MAGVDGANERITQAATTWPGVHAATGVRGEHQLLLGRRELGHLHGDRVAHIPLPKAIWHELLDAGRIQEHPVFPGQAGWGERPMRTDHDVEDVIRILRANYDRAAARVPPRR